LPRAGSPIDTDGYQAMLKAGRKYPHRTWAVEGCNGIGRHIAQRLVADGETVLDVPAKLSARARVFSTGQGRKTDPVDAHSVAVAALRTKGLRQVVVDDATVALRLLADRRDGLGRARTNTVNRLHKLLLELLAGGAKKALSALQARALLATVRPRDIVGRTRRQLAAELITELAVIDKKIKTADAQRRLLPTQARRRQDHHGSHALPETTALRSRLPADGQGCQSGEDGPGRTSGSDCSIQRGRPNPDSRHFGSVTSRTRQHPP
jgi:hypothetical protein